MARLVKDRIKETTTTTGTNNLALGGAVAGYQAFSTLGNGATTFYCIEDANGTAFEVGIGTYTSNTLARTTILDSTNSGNAIVLTSGTHDVFVTYPAGRAGFNDEGLSPTLTASGTITAGKPVIQNANGTVTQVAESTTQESSISKNFATTSTDTTSEEPSSVYESNSQTFNIAYKDSSSGSYGTVVSGTVSNGVITWGTPVVFESSAIDDQPHICSGGNRIHVTYRDSSGNGGIRSASISGTTPTFAAETVFAPVSNAAYGNPMGYHCAYDVSTNYVIVFYQGGTSSVKTYVQPLYHNTSGGT